MARRFRDSYCSGAHVVSRILSGYRLLILQSIFLAIFSPSSIFKSQMCGMLSFNLLDHLNVSPNAKLFPRHFLVAATNSRDMQISKTRNHNSRTPAHPIASNLTCKSRADHTLVQTSDIGFHRTEFETKIVVEVRDDPYTPFCANNPTLRDYNKIK